ncbi:MAG: hypothetical protein OEM97_04235 [Acidimicrobiia bacterium]|nr:hypothetical protein [Acidimicrobiia bacterium]
MTAAGIAEALDAGPTLLAAPGCSDAVMQSFALGWALIGTAYLIAAAGFGGRP